MPDNGLHVTCNDSTGLVQSVKLYGEELLDEAQPCASELYVNGLPLKTRPHPTPGKQGGVTRLKGERFVDHFSGYGLVVSRSMGLRSYMKHPCFGVHYLIRRELADMTDLPCPGPGGPVVEAPLYVDTFSLLNWNWRFWGDDTRMIFPSLHTNGPADEFGHVGYEHDSPEQCKKYMQNVWRRAYPGVMAIHGGLFYNAKTAHWIAITCRRPHVGYILNLNNAGRGVCYDFTLHAPFNIGDSLQMPEVKIYFGKTRDEMMQWMADYITYYYEEPPAWVHKTVWSHGLGWNNQPTWTQQADLWEKQIDQGLGSGISYCLVTNRPIHCGTTPTGYEPDPNHGSIDEFRDMCRRIAKRGVPILIWMSHSGLLPQGGADIDDDWFIRGIDGRACASWGSIDGGMAHCNPGHPGYIEYTKKWIRFYIRECGCKGIFFDCLGWVMPPDFRPRPFMRYPADSNRLTVKFMEEVYACIKECDPEAIMLGEGTSLEGPVNIFSIAANPVRAIDGMGPRDFCLQLNRYSSKRMVIDQGGDYFPASGMMTAQAKPGQEERVQFVTRLMREKGGRDAFTHLVGDMSLIDDILFVAGRYDEATPAASAKDVRLPDALQHATSLVELFSKATVARDAEGVFRGVSPGIYRITGTAKK
ncbi:MAG TPA: hypothetical protein VM141_03685 [Planctomycetota bacterium]|nr:hypothetical protein [Planctomycetota bacterium]